MEKDCLSKHGFEISDPVQPVDKLTRCTPQTKADTGRTTPLNPPAAPLEEDLGHFGLGNNFSDGPIGLHAALLLIPLSERQRRPPTEKLPAMMAMKGVGDGPRSPRCPVMRRQVTS